MKTKEYKDLIRAPKGRNVWLMVARVAALTALVAVSAVAVPAAAAGPAPSRVARASRVVQQAAAAALAESAESNRATPPALQVAPEGVQKEALSVAQAAAPPAPGRPQPPAPTCKLGEGCSYKTLLGYLVITKDLEIPGAPGVGLRLIPTRSALAGGPSVPIVLKPRVVGTSWSGLEIAAQF
jgi:hypothetical protein